VHPVIHITAFLFGGISRSCDMLGCRLGVVESGWDTGRGDIMYSHAIGFRVALHT
jgi:hypothetical protein